MISCSGSFPTEGSYCPEHDVAISACWPFHCYPPWRLDDFYSDIFGRGS